MDTVANLTVEAGNFAPATRSRTDSLKTRALVNFYRMERYDAVTLSSREVQQGFGMWEQAAQEGAPIVVANLFADSRRKKTVFTPYVLKKDQGDKLAVIGFLTRSAWNSRLDTSAKYSFQDPLTMGKLIKKVAKKADHLTVIGEFSSAEADTLVAHFPEIDLIVTSGIKSAERARAVGQSVIIGSNNRGYFGNYVDFAFQAADSTSFAPSTQTLDESIPIDSTVQKFVNTVNESIKAAPAVAAPAVPAPAPAKK